MKNYLKLIVTLLVVSVSFNAYAQPVNNACSGAQSVTPDGTCYNGTTVGATDLWVGQVGCQSGNNAEVWYTFVATASQLDVVITAGTIGGNIEFILVSATGACSGLSITGSLCGPSVLTGTINGLQIGTTYYYTISSTGSTGTFTTCVNNVVPVPVSGQDCAAAAILCDATGFSQGSSSAGFGAQEVSSSNSCWGFGGERQSKWFKFTVGCTGTLEFNINPVISGNDYDFALWNITGDPTGCTTKGSTIACNWSGCKGSTGVTTCTNAVGEPGRVTSGAGCGGGPEAWNVATINVTAGNTYALLVDNFSTSNSGFSLTFGGACGGGTAIIGPNADFTGSLDASCMTYTATKTCVTTNSTYLWSYGDGATSTGMNGSHTYTTTGSYTVSLTVTDALGCVDTYSETINVGCVLPIKLGHFDATFNEKTKTVDLNWLTASEINNDFFTIEKSKDGQIFEVVGIVDGAGNSNTIRTYDTIDKNPYQGTSYYRLKQTDYDGQFAYSQLVAVNVIGAFENVAIFPNPILGVGYLSFSAAANSTTTVWIYDISGRKVWSKDYGTNKGANQLTLETNELSQGMYFLTMSNGEENTTLKFIKE